MVSLYQKAEEFIFQYFKDNASSEFSYHNFLHTQYVVQKVMEIAEHEPVTEQQKHEIILAAWFHDIGYFEDIEQHEVRGAQIAENFLKENSVDSQTIINVANLIKATQWDHVPTTLPEMIIKDADCSHVGSTQFEKISEQLRTEIENLGTPMTEKDWNEENYRFLLFQHKFYTDYAKKHWQPIKFENIIELQENLRKIKYEGMSKSEAKKKKLEKLESPERGIETLFRVTLNNHTRLSEIADSKANILLSVNAIIISIALSTLLPKLAAPKNEYLILPTLVMLSVSVISIISAISATKPNVSKSNVTDIMQNLRKTNLLFFGNFAKISLEDYEFAMNEMMKDKDYLYNSLTRDLYYLGLVLEKKYRILRRTYHIFMFGTIATVIAFVYAFWTNLQEIN